MKSPNTPFVFPKWTNDLRPVLGVAALVIPLYAALLAFLGTSAQTQRVGYMPKQPVAYSHALHAGSLGIDCRYCHTTAESAAMAAIPPTQTCMNCHSHILKDSEKITPVLESYATGKPIKWVRVHDLPDFVYFNHSAHVARGVGCISCHGRVDKMDVVYQDQALTMGWCLDCHRNPEPHLRPVEEVTNMDWVPDKDPKALGQELREAKNINPSQDCSTCHR